MRTTELLNPIFCCENMTRKMFYVTGTRTTPSETVTLLLCGHSVEKMKDELTRQGFTFTRAFRMRQPRFADITTQF